MGVDAGWVSERDHAEPDPDKALALAVIFRAIQDANGSRDIGTTPADQSQAKAFLYARTGEWAAARRAWLEIAEVDDGWLQRRLRVIESGSVRLRATARKPGPRPRTEPSEWDRKVLAFLREGGHLPAAWRKTDLARLLDDAGFRAPKGGPVTRDTAFYFIERHADAFAG